MFFQHQKTKLQFAVIYLLHLLMSVTDINSPLQGLLLPSTNCKKCGVLSQSRSSPWTLWDSAPPLEDVPWQWHVLVNGFFV